MALLPRELINCESRRKMSLKCCHKFHHFSFYVSNVVFFSSLFLISLIIGKMFILGMLLHKFCIYKALKFFIFLLFVGSLKLQYNPLYAQFIFVRTINLSDYKSTYTIFPTLFSCKGKIYKKIAKFSSCGIFVLIIK